MVAPLLPNITTTLVVVNRILPTRPAPTPQIFVFGPESWFVFGFRCFLFFAGAIATVISIQHWAVMPLVARLLAVVVASSLLVWSVWPQPWRYTTRFIANENGVYFAAYPTLTLSRGQPDLKESWLAVPWKHITNIRVATECFCSLRRLASFTRACCPEIA